MNIEGKSIDQLIKEGWTVDKSNGIIAISRNFMTISSGSLYSLDRREHIKYMKRLETIENDKKDNHPFEFAIPQYQSSEIVNGYLIKDVPNTNLMYRDEFEYILSKSGDLSFDQFIRECEIEDIEVATLLYKLPFDHSMKVAILELFNASAWDVNYIATWIMRKKIAMEKFKKID